MFGGEINPKSTGVHVSTPQRFPSQRKAAPPMMFIPMLPCLPAASVTAPTWCKNREVGPVY